MKEFVEKLMERLEEYTEYDTFDIYKEELLINISFETLDDIVNQLAEEYNNGWIPCSERLPKEANDYLVTQYNKNAIDEYCNGSRISKIFFDVEWWDDIDHECGWDIIAWQPLPEPFKQIAE